MRREDKEVIRRNKAFWLREKVERPLISFWIGSLSYHQSQFFQSYNELKKGEIYPDMIVPSRFLKDYRELQKLYNDLDDDALFVAYPIHGFPWVEAIAGASVSNTGESFWTAECLSNWENRKNLVLSERNPWWEKAISFLEILVEEASSRYPVAPIHMRGPSDILAAVRGFSRSLTDLYDYPTSVSRFIKQVEEFLIRMAESQFEKIPPFHEGYANGPYRIWAPSKCLLLQEDAAAFWGAKFYQIFLKEVNSRLAGKFPFTMFHLHSPSLFFVDFLLDMKELNAIQIGCDENGPPIQELIPVLRKIQEREKALLLRGKFALKEIDDIFNNLSPVGLALNIITPDLDNAKKILKTFC